MRPTLRLRHENQAIETCAAIIRAHLPSPEFFRQLHPAGHYVTSAGSRWDFLGKDADLVAVARAIVEAEVAS